MTIQRTTLTRTRGAQTALNRQALIARCLARIESINAAAQLKIEAINEKRARRIEELRKQMFRHAPNLLAYFEKNKATLTAQSAEKTARTEAGSCLWYEGQYSIEVFDEEAAIASLEKKKHEAALRRVVQLDKNYLLEHPEIVAQTPGIRRVQKGKHVFNFEGTEARLEHTFAEGVWSMVFPKKKK